MTTINDFATSYMNQSLPFGGVKESGFDRFAGVEGLRGVCYAKSVCQDRFAICHRIKKSRSHLKAYTHPTFFFQSCPHLLFKYEICNMYHRAQKVVESGQGLAVLFCVTLFIQRLCACSLFSQPQFDVHADQRLIRCVP